MAQGSVRWFNSEMGAQAGFYGERSGVEAPSRDLVATGVAGTAGEAVGGSVDERLAYDIEICARLRACGCTGKDWEVFARALYQKAVRLSFRWIDSGMMFARCRRVGRPISGGDLSDWAPEELKVLAHEVVSENFTLFVQVGIVGGAWNPHRGASLFTYFMNGVVLCFPNVVRRHRTARSQWEHRVNLHDNLDDVDRADIHDYGMSLARCAEMLGGLLAAIGPRRQRRVAELYFVHGLSSSEIADRLDTTEPAIRSLLNRAKQAMQLRYRSEEERHD
ncbi:sigma-70 family RNA polymerase sigma factor [Amycolatopsis umgeniensis]|uniref:RNA polymerase sigma factor 70 region 4 type 2 domain-containing protein n=1 Tax=Amycolatopsis umgeniensis TaxID=336628 RepID=A0A841B8V3_9PSEU|nr:sigma-70 family RNA polymerase sigma factor [Amycolatopsis umgeniensis]MBB5856466.1 hypothetical protein [Amycolatopsis umgeniensis]